MSSNEACRDNANRFLCKNLSLSLSLPLSTFDSTVEGERTREIGEEGDAIQIHAHDVSPHPQHVTLSRKIKNSVVSSKTTREYAQDGRAKDRERDKGKVEKKTPTRGPYVNLLHNP